MQNNESLLKLYKQNDKLGILIVTPDFGHLSSEAHQRYNHIHRNSLYYFLLMVEGKTTHVVDLHPYDLKNNELLFVLPHQIHQLPTEGKGTAYFKIGFDEDCLSLLPKQYPFLVNPYNKHKIQFDAPAAQRLQSIFELLTALLSKMDTQPELILAHLNSLLTEINAAYFDVDKSPADEKLTQYIRFKLFIEENLTSQVPITQIAKKLSLNTNSLYNIVKHYSGLSPKAYMTSRLILEAKRRLYYSESSIKELAYDLGFNDPEYFSRLFKKETGKTTRMFIQDLSG